MADQPVPQYYADQFTMALGPYGCALTFGLTPPVPPGSEGAQATPVATMRMSLEHLKAVTFIVHRQLVKYQKDFGVEIAVPAKSIEALGATKSEWAAFWGEL